MGFVLVGGQSEYKQLAINKLSAGRQLSVPKGHQGKARNCYMKILPFA
jgi:hypothetical protein